MAENDLPEFPYTPDEIRRVADRLEKFAEERSEGAGSHPLVVFALRYLAQGLEDAAGEPFPAKTFPSVESSAVHRRDDGSPVNPDQELSAPG